MKLQNHPRKEISMPALVLFLDVEVVSIYYKYHHNGNTHKGNFFGSGGKKNGCKHGKGLVG